MSGNLLRKLSPREESTLCMIAHGVSSLRALRSGDVSRLQNFGFAEVVEGAVTLTPLGIERFAIAAGTMTSRH